MNDILYSANWNKIHNLDIGDFCKNHVRQNVGKEKQKSTCFGIFYKNRPCQVMNFIPVKVSTLYRVIHGFEFVCFLPLICRELTCVSSCVYWNVEFK
jgi:hypothetical protein